jgi:hypothetical protein
VKKRIIYDPAEPVVIREYAHEWLAAPDQAALEAAEIPSILLQSRFGETVDRVVRLAVRREHVATAREVLEDLPED